MKYKHQEKYDQKQKKKGLVRVCVWVPEPQRGDFIDHAKQLVKNRKTED